MLDEKERKEEEEKEKQRRANEARKYCKKYESFFNIYYLILILKFYR